MITANHPVSHLADGDVGVCGNAGGLSENKEIFGYRYFA